jgi:hypothetical protein
MGTPAGSFSPAFLPIGTGEDAPVPSVDAPHVDAGDAAAGAEALPKASAIVAPERPAGGERTSRKPLTGVMANGSSGQIVELTERFGPIPTTEAAVEAQEAPIDETGDTTAPEPEPQHGETDYRKLF